MAKTDAAPDLDAAILEEAALRIYLDLRMGRMRGFNAETVARRAYQEARAFAEVTQAIRGGEPIQEPEADEAPLFARVTLWNMAAGQHGEPMEDGNGRPIVEVQPVDRWSYAPNLPKEHPINQRYYPNALAAGILCDRAGKPLQHQHN